jgi:hypothetical protein
MRRYAGVVLCALTVNLCAAGPISPGGTIKVGGGAGGDSYPRASLGSSEVVSLDHDVLRGAARASYRGKHDFAAIVEGTISDADALISRTPRSEGIPPEETITEQQLVSSQAVVGVGWAVEDPRFGEIFGVELGLGLDRGGQAGGTTYHVYTALWLGVPSLVYGWFAFNDPNTPSLHTDDFSFGLGGDYGRLDWQAGIQHTGAKAAVNFEVIEDRLALGLEGVTSLDRILSIGVDEPLPADFLDHSTYSYVMMNVRLGFGVESQADEQREPLNRSEEPDQ